MRTSFVLLFALISTPAAAADQFDLVCKGEWRFGPTDPYEPHDFRLRVDLAAKKYCELDCKVLKPIEDVQPQRIVFRTATEIERASDTLVYHYVDRTNGNFRQFLSSQHPYHWQDLKGTCEPATFSGFGEEKAKF